MRATWGWLSVLALSVCACAPETADHAPAASARATPSSHDQSAVFVLDGKSALGAALAVGELLVKPPSEQPGFTRIGLRYDADGGDPMIEARVERQGVWSEWQRAPVTYESGQIFNAHVVLDAPAERAALRPAPGAPGKLRFLAVELFERGLSGAPLELPAGEIGTAQMPLAPASLVHPRSAWGAASTPDCGAWHTPSYLTIHHTVTPNDDPTPPAERIKGIQSYHIGTNGWCDIGYHFLVSQDGDRWQGWKTEEKVGIHVGGHNTNNVGISFLGSYHLAEPPAAQVNGVVPLVKWLSDTYAIPLDKAHLLGHGEWAGQSTQCPGSFLLGRLQQIIDAASASDSEKHVDIVTAWTTIDGQERDFVSGSSSGVFDALVDQDLEGEIRIRNGSERPATDNVLLGYFIEGPFLAPVSYVIEHDLPAKDGQSFVTSPADAAPGNPAKDALPAEGVLDIGVLEPGQTVRVRLQVRAAQYGFGQSDHPDLRAWVKHVGDYYGEQDGWDDAVEANSAGKVLRHHSEADVFSSDEWRFDGPAGDDLEGWTIGNELSDLAVNVVDHALAMKASGADPFAVSPSWTRVDADRKKEIQLRARQHGTPREAKLYFKRDGEDWSEERQVSFSTSGSGVWDDVVLDMTDHPSWSGLITGLRLDAWEGGSYEGAEAWFDLDFLRAGGEIDPPGSGGSGGNGGSSWGSGGSSGSSAASEPKASEDGGCVCTTSRPSGQSPSALLALLAIAALGRRRLNRRGR